MREQDERVTAELQSAVDAKSSTEKGGTFHTTHDEESAAVLKDEESDPTNPTEELETVPKDTAIQNDTSTEDVTAEANEHGHQFVMKFNDLVNMFGEATYKQDLHAQSMSENRRASHIWEQGEEYHASAERLFNFIQVFTACLNSFAHGANDVANTIAPLSAVLYIYQNGNIESKTGVQKWLLAAGGAGIVLGLLLYGYRVIKSLGYKLTKLSPSRGASAELAASLTVVTAAFLAIPVSTTQCVVGAISGVGLVNGPKNVQWLFLLRVMIGWVVMFVFGVFLSAGIFAFAAYSPDI